MSDCIFCSIIEGEIPSRTVYEDSDVKAFLDVNPLNRGHTLVVPKKHVATLNEMDEDTSRSVFNAVRELASDVADAVNAPAYNIGLNNGPEAGQEVPHLHFHIVPRFEGDGGGPIHALMPNPPEITDNDMDDIEHAIKQAIDA